MSVRLLLPANASADLRRRSQPVPVSTVQEQIEFLASKFLLKQHQRILGQQSGQHESPSELARRQIIKERFDELQSIYTARVRELIGKKARIDFLRRCIPALCIRNAGRRSVLANLHMLEDVCQELDEREAEEQDILEGIQEVALEILSLD